MQLLKRSQDFRAEKLRTILLLEADFNMNNKVLGSDAMCAGEASNQLTRDNYGGRKRHIATEVSLNSVLTYNMVWGRRGRAIIMSNDAKGCYDRISHTVVNLCLRRFGSSKPALQSMLRTIQEMDHHVRTAFGDSKDSYGRKSREPPPQGILQGNGAAGAGWAAIASVLIETMRKAGFGYKDWSLIRKRAVEITCFAFVDDTDIIHVNNNPNVSTSDLISEAQEALSMWEGLIRATGGDLAPEKSYWYLLDVQHTNGKWNYQTKTDAPGELFLKQGTHQVQRHEPSVSKTGYPPSPAPRTVSSTRSPRHPIQTRWKHDR
ncbi:MAG: hypothetical protein LC687_07455 [Actinobacteria bacterium]|nr:hypothetical protein [Actinomycetota bacterium]